MRLEIFHHTILLLLSSLHLIQAAYLPPASNSTPALSNPSGPVCHTLSPNCARPLYTDCSSLVTYILSRPSASRKLREFTSTPPSSQSDWQVPSTFFYKSCRITLALIPNRGSLEWSSFAEIAENAREASDWCLGAGTPAYNAGCNVAGLADGLGLLVHGRIGGVMKTGDGERDERVDVTRRGGDGGGQRQSCDRVDEGSVVDLEALGVFNGSSEGMMTGGATSSGQVSKAKMRR